MAGTVRALLRCAIRSTKAQPQIFVHANSAADVPARIESLALAAGLGRPAAHSQLASGVDLVLHLARDRDGVRRLREVAVPVRDDAGLVRMETAVRFTSDGREVTGPAATRLERALDAS